MSGSSGTLARYLSSSLLNAFTEILVKFLSSAGRMLKSRGPLTDRHAYRMFLISVGALFLIDGELHLRPSRPPIFTEYIFPEVRSGTCFSRIRHIYISPYIALFFFQESKDEVSQAGSSNPSFLHHQSS